MRRQTASAGVVVALLFAIAPDNRVLWAQSLSYNSGQTVSPAFEGWEQDADGSRYFLFGYMNKNWEEELDVPIGPANGFAPGDVDRGQPTHFLPRRNRFVFRVPVPRGFTEKDELVWTLTTQGKTTKAYASLRTDYLIDDVVKASETGALGAGTSNPTVRSNKAPTVRIEGQTTRTAKVGEWITLVATIADDGVPKARTRDELLAVLARRAARSATPGESSNRLFLSPPSRVTVGKNLGLHLSWFVYRGTAAVQFDPVQIKPWEDTRAGANSPWAPIWFAPPLPADGKITTRVRFDAPGTYVLRALADDGALTGGENVTIVVTNSTN
ncbi:MAG TPA: hypothetical protein VJ691_19225 [Vicinamibacterales bacterium]|nr:hypothetical protein [Vicinamibacterales bacterium]